jgi:hypothetical protein
MSKELDFNFCIIPNPFASGGRNIIFISKSGEDFLDKKIVDTNQYKDIKEILEQFGYTETDSLQFESSNNIPDGDITLTDMRMFLEDCGLTYSRDLEVNVIKELSNIKADLEDSTQDVDYDTETPIKDKTKNKLIESKKEMFDFEYQEPDYKDKISLYFYLFLEFGFNHYGKPIIQFGGDFKDSDDYDDRNYIKIVKSDFERVRDPQKPNSIILSSCKTQKDFIKEAGMLYGGFFKYQKREEDGDAMLLKEEKHTYKLADVRKFLSPNQSIVVETNRMGYDRLIKLSKKIKTESIIEGNTTISTEDIEVRAEEIKDHFIKKMNRFSEAEDFESAARMKKDIDFIEDRIDLISEMDKPEITTDEYFKLFYIP